MARKAVSLTKKLPRNYRVRQAMQDEGAHEHHETFWGGQLCSADDRLRYIPREALPKYPWANQDVGYPDDEVDDEVDDDLDDDLNDDLNWYGPANGDFYQTPIYPPTSTPEAYQEPPSQPGRVSNIHLLLNSPQHLYSSHKPASIQHLRVNQPQQQSRKGTIRDILNMSDSNPPSPSRKREERSSFANRRRPGRPRTSVTAKGSPKLASDNTDDSTEEQFDPTRKNRGRFASIYKRPPPKFPSVEQLQQLRRDAAANTSDERDQQPSGSPFESFYNQNQARSSPVHPPSTSQNQEFASGDGNDYYTTPTAPGTDTSTLYRPQTPRGQETQDSGTPQTAIQDTLSVYREENDAIAPKVSTSMSQDTPQLRRAAEGLVMARDEESEKRDTKDPERGVGGPERDMEELD